MMTREITTTVTASAIIDCDAIGPSPASSASKRPRAERDQIRVCEIHVVEEPRDPPVRCRVRACPEGTERPSTPPLPVVFRSIWHGNWQESTVKTRTFVVSAIAPTASWRPAVNGTPSTGCPSSMRETSFAAPVVSAATEADSNGTITGRACRNRPTPGDDGHLRTKTADSTTGTNTTSPTRSPPGPAPGAGSPLPTPP